METINDFIFSGDKLTGEDLRDFIERHQRLTPKYESLENMYLGYTEIFDYPAKDTYKPDNRIAVPFAKKIVDTFNGFSSSVPVKLSHDDETIHEKINEFWYDNNMESSYSDLAKGADIHGIYYVYMYQDEDATTRMTLHRPENMFVIFDDSIKKRKIYGVRYWYEENENGMDTLAGELYTRQHRLNFQEDKERKIIIDEPNANLDSPDHTLHMFDKVPIIYFVNNEEHQGLIEPVKSMIDAVDKAISEKANDVDYFADAYLAILGAELDDKGVYRIRDNRIINIFGTDEAAKLVVEFLDKPDGDQTQENLLDRLERLIYSTSMIPDINNEKFGNESGIAREMKLQPMKYLANQKEAKFKRGLSEVFELYFSLPTNVEPVHVDEYRNIEYTFTRDMPRDLAGEADIMNKLDGDISEEKRLSILSIIDDPKAEIERMEEEDLSRRQARERLSRQLTDEGLNNE